MPSKFGIGDFGQEAYNFVDLLQAAGQKLWQILPLNPVVFLESPYQCLSAFAGNHLLISLEKLLEQRLLTAKEIEEDYTGFSAEKVDFCRYKGIFFQ